MSEIEREGLWYVAEAASLWNKSYLGFYVGSTSACSGDQSSKSFRLHWVKKKYKPVIRSTDFCIVLCLICLVFALYQICFTVSYIWIFLTSAWTIGNTNNFFPSLFIFRFLLLGLIRPLFIDSLILIVEYILHPFVNGVVRPVLLSIYGASASVSEILVVCMRPITTVLQSFRLVEINYTRKYSIDEI